MSNILANIGIIVIKNNTTRLQLGDCLLGLPLTQILPFNTMIIEEISAITWRVGVMVVSPTLEHNYMKVKIDVNDGIILTQE